MVRLREISHDDRHILRGFDRGMPLGGPACVGGHRHWGDHRSRRPAGDGGSQFGIETVHGSRLVGSLSTVESDPLTGVFSYSIGIGRPHRRCGYASDAVIALLSHMFGQRGFRTCVISVYSGNLASLSLHGRLGFRTEGRTRDSQVQRGNIRFLVSMSITASDFAARFSTEPDPDMHPADGTGALAEDGTGTSPISTIRWSYRHRPCSRAGVQCRARRRSTRRSHADTTAMETISNTALPAMSST